MKKFKKILIVASAAIIFIFVGLLILFQTDFFKNKVKNEIVNSYKNNFNGELKLTNLDGNIFSGFNFRDVKILLDSETVFQTENILIKYDLIALVFKSITLPKLEITKPKMIFSENENGELNISKLLKNKKSEMSDWEFRIKQFLVIDGAVFINTLNRREILTDLNSELQFGSYNGKTKILLNNFSLISKGIKVKNIFGEFLFENNFVGFKNIKIETENSHLNFNFSLSGSEIYNPEKITLDKLKLQFDNSTFSKSDIEHLANVELRHFPKKIILNLTAEGNNGNAEISKANFKINSSEINITGKVNNIISRNDLVYEFNSFDSKINTLDLNEIINLSHAYVIKNNSFDLSFNLSGKNENFNINTLFQIQENKIKINSDFKKNKTNIKIEVKDFDFENIIENPKNKIILNGNSEIEIHDKNNFNAEINFGNSKVNEIKLTDGKIFIEKNNIQYYSDYNLQANHGEVIGGLNFNDGFKNISVDAKFSKLNLSKLLDSNFTSNSLNGEIKLFSKYLSFESDTASLSLQVNNINGSGNDSLNLKINSVNRNYSDRKITLNSNFVNGEISGDFKYEDLISSIKNISKDVSEDTRNYFLSNEKNIEPTPNFNAKYQFKVDNLIPLKTILKNVNLNALGEFGGELNSVNGIINSNGSLQIHSGKIISENNQIIFDKTNLQYELKKYSANSILRKGSPIDFKIQTTSKNLFVNKNSFSHIAFEGDIKNGIGRLLFFMEVDSISKIEIHGNIATDNKNLILKLSNVYGQINNFVMHNQTPITISANKNFVKIDAFKFKQNNEEISSNGLLVEKNNLKGDLRIRSLMIKNLFFIASDDAARFIKGTDGNLNLEVQLNGTLTEPNIKIKGATTTLKLNSLPLGKLSIDAGLTKNDLRLDLLFASDKNPNNPFINFSGTIPISEKRTNDSLNVNVTFNNFPSTLFDPFVTEVENLSGNVTAEIKYSGTNKNPIANGFIETQNTKLVLTQNGIEYEVVGKININNNYATFSNASIKNLQNEYSKGKVNISGSAEIKDFIPNSFEIKLNGELQVLSNQSKHYTPQMYGQIIASTENESIIFRSDSKSTDLIGKIFLTNASVNLPPTRENIFIQTEQQFNLVIIDDTSNAVIDSLSIPDIVEFLEARMKQQEQIENKKITKINYDLTFQTLGSVVARFIFNPVTNEELHAYLDGSLSLKTLQNKVQITGQVDLGNNSYYTFYKKFSAKGSLIYTGDAKNPKLKISAMYEGEHKKLDTTQSNPYEKTRIKLSINGDRNEPIIKIALFVLDKNKNEIERFGDVESDAISFLLTSSEGVPGKFREDLTLNDKQNIAEDLGISIANSIVSNFTSTILSGMMMDFIRTANIPFVTSAEFKYSSDAPVLKLSGEVLDAYWSVGGKIFNDINNTNLNVQLPLSAIVGNKNLRNLIFELERKVDPLETNTQKQAVHGARIYYKILF